MKTLELKDIDLKMTVEPEDIASTAGNVMQSGDPDYDAKAENEIIARINAGDIWAWCFIKVTGSYKGLTAWEGLGFCSYVDEADFKAGGYYDDMCSNVLRNLQNKLEILCNE